MPKQRQEAEPGCQRPARDGKSLRHVGVKFGAEPGTQPNKILDILGNARSTFRTIVLCRDL